MNEPIIIFNAWIHTALSLMNDEVNPDESVSIETHDSIIDSRKWPFFLLELQN